MSGCLKALVFVRCGMARTPPPSVDERILLDDELGEEKSFTAELPAGATVVFEYEYHVEYEPAGVYHFTVDDEGTLDAHEQVEPKTVVAPMILEYDIETTDEYTLYVAGEADTPGCGGEVTVRVLE